MNALQSVLLGILQGIAEFLPISSSGHLAIAQYLLKLDDMPLLYDVMLHLATLLAVVLFFWKQLIDLICAFFRFVCGKQKPEDKPKITMIWALLCSTAITGVFGVFFSKIIPDLPLKFVCGGFIVTGLLLIFSSRSPKKQSEPECVSIKQGVWCGFAQGIGVLPGISRSGITISAALFSGIHRETAGEYSFILSIPAILGAFILEAKDLSTLSSSVSISVITAGCAAAFVAGLASLAFLTNLIKRGKIAWFAAYLIPLGIFGLIFFPLSA